MLDPDHLVEIAVVGRRVRIWWVPNAVTDTVASTRVDQPEPNPSDMDPFRDGVAAAAASRCERRRPGGFSRLVMGATGGVSGAASDGREGQKADQGEPTYGSSRE